LSPTPIPAPVIHRNRGTVYWSGVGVTPDAGDADTVEPRAAIRVTLADPHIVPTRKITAGLWVGDNNKNARNRPPIQPQPANKIWGRRHPRGLDPHI
jgi:hypothetical protein